MRTFASAAQWDDCARLMRRLTIQLSHDLLQIRLQGVVRRDEHVEAVLLDHLEVFGGVDVALVQDPGGRGGANMALVFISPFRRRDTARQT